MFNVHVVFLKGACQSNLWLLQSNSGLMQPSRKQLGNPATAENMQSGARSCLVDMLIATIVCKYTCSFNPEETFLGGIMHNAHQGHKAHL